MIDIADRSQPSDSHVARSRPVFHPQVGKLIRYVGPSQTKVVGAAIALAHLERGSDRREHGALEPRRRTTAAVQRRLHIHRGYRVVVAELYVVLAAPYDLDRTPGLLRQNRG